MIYVHELARDIRTLADTFHEYILITNVIENIVTGRCTCTTYNRYLVADEISR